MTARLGSRSMDFLRYSRGKALCHLVSVTRTDGKSLNFTDWDSTITVNGVTYFTARTVGFTAERREAAMRSGDQDFFGVIDGQHVKIADLAGARYRGAIVRTRVVDARYPWVDLERNTKRVTDVAFTRTGWTATMQMLSEKLEAPRADRFHGVCSQTCLYQLGDPRTCKKDISTWETAGARITSIVTDRVTFLTHASSWKASYANDFYREGEYEFIWAAPTASSTITSGITAGVTTVVTDTSAAYAVDELIGQAFRILSGANGYVLEYKSVVSNTATTITLLSAPSNSYSSGQSYDVCGESDMKGVILPIAYYKDSTRQIDLFFPSPRNLVVGESGIVRPGCDGRISTCANKYNNLPNHGAIDAHGPTPADIISPPEDD